MKRIKLVKHLRENGCIEFREGANHTIWKNTANNKFMAVPRHTEIGDVLANEICKQLSICKVK
jgi:mRNA interferase HicA